MDCKISKESIEAMNEIIKEFKTTLQEMSFWEINVIQYVSAITLIERHGKLKEMKMVKSSGKKRWESELENQINVIRRKISQVTVVMDCLKNNSFTKKQKAVSTKVKQLCGNLKNATLVSKLALLKHDLKVHSTKLTDMRKKAERSRINYQFAKNQKQT